ncbi:hypothetical protein [Xanthomonas hortorum]|uniref:Uncharacterized protein n=1 Tax=Xanthomonas hortorum pv. hederae TaxID=453603 RepID=A0A9X3Z057_9XANT|nr:hypothetical protein [Xanthomonas hortorum]MCE4370571.1 hypothetical protein [Xanthomonas hortorum pv. hederae]MDC8637810.1 hypothetical protein [Xanthomonas hortorum pv. hederae]PUF00882.1 hypothetical protein C7T87_06230 [Xanthomonas hortorum pv. hederae]
MSHRVWVLRAQSGHALSKEKATAFGKLEAPVLHAFNRKNASLKLDAARAAGGRSAGAVRLSHGA